MRVQMHFSLRAAHLLVNCKANAVLRHLLCIGGKIRRSGYDLSRGPIEICRCKRPLDQANALGLAPTNHISAEDDPRRYAFPAKSCQTLRASRTGQQSDLVSGNPNFAVCDAIRISHAKANSRPPPRAWPSISAIVTKGSAAR
jgi:hypothetical protein